MFTYDEIHVCRNLPLSRLWTENLKFKCFKKKTEIQSTVREPVRANMYRGVSSAYTIIVVSYWTLAFSGYWAFGSQVQPYILSSLTAPRWATVMANLFAVIQIAGCFQVN
jgi:hypothetical protein